MSPGPRTFDPAVIARHETDAWVAYYRHEWRTVLRAGIGMVREGFGMPPLATLRGAWCVARATRAWSSMPDNDPEGARCWMREFYTLVIEHQEVDLDPERAAELEVEWWRLHRARQYGDLDHDGPLVESLVALYAYVYAVPEAGHKALREAARERVRAMVISDAWVADGSHLPDERVEQERALLVSSYTALRAVVA